MPFCPCRPPLPYYLSGVPGYGPSESLEPIFGSSNFLFHNKTDLCFKMTSYNRMTCKRVKFEHEESRCTEMKQFKPKSSLIFPDILKIFPFSIRIPIFSLRLYILDCFAFRLLLFLNYSGVQKVPYWSTKQNKSITEN